MKALIVDDDLVLADLLAFTLRREGFQVLQARDGQAALRRWAEEDPDIILLDVNMPKVDGFAVCRRIRAQADTPIILLTVRGEEYDIIRGLELGADRDMLRQLVHRLRDKIEPEPTEPIYIETIPGLGYGLSVHTDS
jgi:DNA-binding response OmpR family regulator